ncbi:holin [Streptomyces sp. NPDC018031]|uniref:holin n=1 Tax=Streptomyces sp. NPDC018031 TaxID=3365033 RepID=UPI0037B10C47
MRRTTAPVEAKVKAATTGTLLVSLLLAVLNTAQEDGGALLDPLPEWLQAIVIALIPPVVTFLSGWQARHTPRDQVRL